MLLIITGLGLISTGAGLLFLYPSMYFLLGLATIIPSYNMLVVPTLNIIRDIDPNNIMVSSRLSIESFFGYATRKCVIPFLWALFSGLLWWFVLVIMINRKNEFIAGMVEGMLND